MTGALEVWRRRPYLPAHAAACPGRCRWWPRRGGLQPVRCHRPEV